MADTVKLVCDRCGREEVYPRSFAPDVPTWVKTLSQSHCPADGCDTGDRCIETWLDADGIERDPEDQRQGGGRG